MSEIQLTTQCSACGGTGIRYYNSGPNGPLVEENPCSECGGDGRAPSFLKLESTVFDDLDDKLDDILDKLADIKEKLDE